MICWKLEEISGKLISLLKFQLLTITVARNHWTRHISVIAAWHGVWTRSSAQSCDLKNEKKMNFLSVECYCDCKNFWRVFLSNVIHSLLGDWILLGPFLLKEDGELLLEELFGVVGFDPPETICSCNCLWCCCALLSINRSFLSFSFSRASPDNGHDWLKYWAKACCSPTRKERPFPWLYSHSAFKLSIGFTTYESIALTDIPEIWESFRKGNFGGNFEITYTNLTKTDGNQNHCKEISIESLNYLGKFKDIININRKTKEIKFRSFSAFNL